MKRLVLVLVVALSFAMVGNAHAVGAPVAGLFKQAPTATLLSDNSAEFLYDADSSGTVTVGDVLIGIVGINTIAATTIGSGTGYAEVTAILALKIDTASDIDFAPPGPDDSIGEQNVDLWQFTSVPLTNSAADLAILNWSTGQILGGLFTFTPAPGSANDGLLFAQVFEDPLQDYTRSSTVQAGFTSATNTVPADFRWDVSMIVANGDFVSVIAPLNLSQVTPPGFPAATAIDNTNISMDGTITRQAWPGLVFNNNITGGNGGFSSPEVGSGFPIYDNLDFTVTATQIPEPATMLLLGSGLVGLAGVARRRFKK